MKIGVIGYGMMARMLMDSMQKVDGYELWAIAGLPRGEEKLKKFKEDYKLSYYTTDYHDLLNDKDIDAIYVATPNNTHYAYGVDILKAGKHCLMEKPFCSFVKETEELMELAKRNNVILFEAITNQHLPSFKFIKENLAKIGDIKLIIMSFCKNSSRYDRFKQGDIAPVFDLKQHGGALGDLNVYNIHLALGLFGKPKKVSYEANLNNGLDTSGIVYLDYDGFKAALLAGKDNNGPYLVSIQGDNGYFVANDCSSIIKNVEMHINKEDVISYQNDMEDHYYYELAEFMRLVDDKDFNKAQEYLSHDLMVMEVLEEARNSAGIFFDPIHSQSL